MAFYDLYLFLRLDRNRFLRRCFSVPRSIVPLLCRAPMRGVFVDGLWSRFPLADAGVFGSWSLYLASFFLL